MNPNFLNVPFPHLVHVPCLGGGSQLLPVPPNRHSHPGGKLQMALFIAVHYCQPHKGAKEDLDRLNLYPAKKPLNLTLQFFVKGLQPSIPKVSSPWRSFWTMHNSLSQNTHKITLFLISNLRGRQYYWADSGSLAYRKRHQIELWMGILCPYLESLIKPPCCYCLEALSACMQYEVTLHWLEVMLRLLMNHKTRQAWNCLHLLTDTWQHFRSYTSPKLLCYCATF